MLKVALLIDQDLKIIFFNSRALLSSIIMRAQGTRRGRQPVSQEEEISHLRQTNANLTLWLWDGGWDPRILLPELNSQAVPGGLKVTSDRVI